MRTREEFINFYKNEIIPYVRKLEEERKKTVYNLYFWMVAYGLFFFLPYIYVEIWILSTFFSIDINLLYIILYILFIIAELAELAELAGEVVMIPMMCCGTIFLLPFILWVSLYYTIIESFVSNFKKQIILKIIKFFDPNLRYSRLEFIDSDKFNKSRLFGKIDESDESNPFLWPGEEGSQNYSGDDLVWGKVGHTFMEFSDISTNSFSGIFYVADFNKTFKCPVFVLPGKSLKFFKSSQKRDKHQVILENPEFEQRYSTYCEDQNVARYILTPDLMERIVKLSKSIESMGYTGVSISFVGNQFNMAVPYHNMLEPNLYRPLYESADPLAYFEDLLLFYSIVKELDLNTRIWSKAPVVEAVPTVMGRVVEGITLTPGVIYLESVKKADHDVEWNWSGPVVKPKVKPKLVYAKPYWEK